MLFFLTIAIGAVAVSAQAITIDNEGKQTKVEKAQLAKLKRVTLKVSDHGKDATFEGVALVEVLKLGGVEFGEKLRGKRLTSYVLAEAADGYRVVYAIAEIDPGFTDKQIILADRRDGKELPENARSYQIVTEGEKRAGRWVRQVVKLSIVQVVK